MTLAVAYLEEGDTDAGPAHGHDVLLDLLLQSVQAAINVDRCTSNLRGLPSHAIAAPLLALTQRLAAGVRHRAGGIAEVGVAPVAVVGDAAAAQLRRRPKRINDKAGTETVRLARC